MPFVITEPCIGVKDASCADVCPSGAIHPTLDESEFNQHQQLYIDAEQCIDCSACVAACPVGAIFEEAEVPQQWRSFIQLNAYFFKQ